MTNIFTFNNKLQNLDFKNIFLLEFPNITTIKISFFHQIQRLNIFLDFTQRL